MKMLEKMIWRFFNGYNPTDKKKEVIEFDHYTMKIIPKI